MVVSRQPSGGVLKYLLFGASWWRPSRVRVKGHEARDVSMRGLLGSRWDSYPWYSAFIRIC